MALSCRRRKINCRCSCREDVVMDGIQSPIKADPEWAKTTYNGQEAFRETDTFDTFMESSWYYARYCSRTTTRGCWIRLLPTTGCRWISTSAVSSTPVCTCSTPASSTSCCVTLAWSNSDEPFKRLLCQGMVLADAFYYKDEKGGNVWVSPTERQGRA